MLKSAINFLKRLYAQRSLVWMLTKRTLQSRYAGTFAGIVWAVVNPLMMIFVYWFVFSVGFRVKPLADVPFIIVFLCGLMPWALFSETLTTNVSAITSNANLVKKTVFPTEILPVVNLFASLVTHGIMISILIVLLVANHVSFSLSIVKFFFYFGGLMLFSLGLSWFFSALNIFYRDIGQALGVILNLWFWMTPIAWMIDMIPRRWQFVIKLNPTYYVVEGYRSSFISHYSFAHSHWLDLYFWGVCLFVVISGALVFKKLKPEFADAL